MNYRKILFIKPSLALFPKDESQQTLSVSDKWCQIILAANNKMVVDYSHLPNVFVCAILTWSGFSQL